ncbi:MAG: c-type cytochrome [bacterium]
MNPILKNGLSVVVFVVGVVGLFIYLGELVTEVSGGAVAQAPVEGVSPEAGESIYFGKGKCSTCHSIGDRGTAIRGPNHGVYGKFPTQMGMRAEERAMERSRKTGNPFTPTDYLVESLADPGAYVVSGYKDEMPLVYKPPIRLSPDEITAVILFLQSLGGEVAQQAIKLPDKIKLAAKQPETAPWEPYLAGDSENGQELFFNEESNAGCARCHTVAGKGGEVGPELTTVAGTRTAQFIVESILKPSAEIASGFEPYLVETKDGRFLTGVLKERTEQGVSLKTGKGKLLRIPSGQIKEVVPQDISIMPDGFADDLTVQEFHDVLAYVLTLTGEPPPKKKADDDEDSEDEDSEEASEDDDDSEDEETDSEETSGNKGNGNQ